MDTIRSKLTTITPSIHPDKFLHNSVSSFLLEKTLIQLVLAVYLGSVLQELFTSIVQGFIMPLLLLLVPNSQVQTFSDIQIIFLGATIDIGSIIYNIINMFLGFLISYFFVRYILNTYISN